MIKVMAKGVQEAVAELNRIEKQIPFATALALTRTAQLAKTAIEGEMKSVFDRPTRWTLNSLRLFPAKKTKLEAKVWMKNEADKSIAPTITMQPQIEGGGRRKKRGEAGLTARGILAAGKYAMPGKGAKLNSFGNISGGQMQKILSGLGAQHDRHQNSTDSKRSIGNKRAFFVMGRGDGAIGIAQRTGKRTVKMLLAFVKRPSYSKRLDFYGLGNKVIEQHLDRELREAMEHAIRTAR